MYLLKNYCKKSEKKPDVYFEGLKACASFPYYKLKAKAKNPHTKQNEHTFIPEDLHEKENKN